MLRQWSSASCALVGHKPWHGTLSEHTNFETTLLRLVPHCHAGVDSDCPCKCCIARVSACTVAVLTRQRFPSSGSSQLCGTNRQILGDRSCLQIQLLSAAEMESITRMFCYRLGGILIGTVEPAADPHAVFCCFLTQNQFEAALGASSLSRRTQPCLEKERNGLPTA